MLCYAMQVTYMYYTGRLEVFNENFPAVSNLGDVTDIQTSILLSYLSCVFGFGLRVTLWSL